VEDGGEIEMSSDTYICPYCEEAVELTWADVHVCAAPAMGDAQPCIRGAEESATWQAPSHTCKRCGGELDTAGQCCGCKDIEKIWREGKVTFSFESLSVDERIADALERIADSLEKQQK